MNNVSMEDDGLVKRTTRCLQIKYLEKVNGRRDGSRGLSEGFSAAWWDLCTTKAWNVSVRRSMGYRME